MKARSTMLTALFVFAPLADVWAEQAVGHWDFSEEASIVRDGSGGGHQLHVDGCQWVESKLGKALRVPANSARIWCDKPGAALRPTGAISLIAWVRPMGAGDYCAVVNHGKGWGNEGTVGYRLLIYHDGVRLLLSAGRVVNLSGGKIIRGQWSQVAATYDGKKVVIFVNGRAVRREPLEGLITYQGVEDQFEVGCGDGRGLDGDFASLRVFDRALPETQIAADWQAGKGICLSGEEIAAERYAKLDKCSLSSVPDAPFVRDRHTTLLAHMDANDNCDADYCRWDGRAGGWRLNHDAPGRFGSGVELPAGSASELGWQASARTPTDSGAPILYRGAANCTMQRGTCEFWMCASEGIDLLADDKDRYLLTILPEWHVGYGKRPSVHLVLRTHAATNSLQFAANTQQIGWYSHLNGARIADSARTVLHMPLNVLAEHGWHHVLCSWSMEDEGRIWLLVDGRGVTTKLATAAGSGVQIPCYKIFLGGSYFPEVYCPSAPAVLDEFRLQDETVADRLAGGTAAPTRVKVDDRLMMQGEDLCRHFLDFTADLQMGGGWEGIYTWPSLMPDESPGSYAAVAEDEYTMRHITPAFLRAYEVLGDDRYLRVAENCGQMLVKNQDENGAWCQGYIIMPDKAYPVSPGQGAIQEGTQTDPLRILFWLWRITDRPEYRDAAQRSAKFVLRGQKPDGAWPLTVNSHTMKPGGGYGGYSTLNDGATLWGMKAMLMGWHLTDDRKYLDALRKAGQWVIDSQLPGKACGWAEQYGDDGKPAWARDFEPPGACVTSIGNAAEALFLLYDLTGDDKYLAPLGRCVQWGLDMPDQYQGYLYYDAETGEPLTAKGYKVYRFGDPDFKEARPYKTARDLFARLQTRINARSNGPLIPSRWGLMPRAEFEGRPVTIESIASTLEAVAAAVQAPIANLSAFRCGEFPAGRILSEHVRHGRNFWPGKGAPDVQRVLDYIQCAKAVCGETVATAVPSYADDYFGPIDPERDWYKTPLLRVGS